MAKVNCSDATAANLCRDESVDTYPSIRVYRKGQNLKSHEVYHGERSVAAITAWATHVIQQGNDPKSKVVDVDKDGVMDSHHGSGCRMSGSLKVQKSPGMIKVQAISDGHAFDWTTMDVSHTVTHLSFGQHHTEDRLQHVIPPHILSSITTMDGKEFTSANDVPTTHEHMVKVVPHRVIYPHARWSFDPPEKSVRPPWTGFGFVYHSNNIQKSGEVPEVRINYDILPYTMQFAFRQDTLYDFLTGICAILGGVFVVSGLIGRISDKILRNMSPFEMQPSAMPY